MCVVFACVWFVYGVCMDCVLGKVRAYVCGVCVWGLFSVCDLCVCGAYVCGAHVCV